MARYDIYYIPLTKIHFYKSENKTLTYSHVSEQLLQLTLESLLLRFQQYATFICSVSIRVCVSMWPIFKNTEIFPKKPQNRTTIHYRRRHRKWFLRNAVLLDENIRFHISCKLRAVFANNFQNHIHLIVFQSISFRK